MHENVLTRDALCGIILVCIYATSGVGTCATNAMNNNGGEKMTTQKYKLEFTRGAIFAMEKYYKYRYLLISKLEKDRAYTIEEVDKILKSEIRRKLN